MDFRGLISGPHQLSRRPGADQPSNHASLQSYSAYLTHERTCTKGRAFPSHPAGVAACSGPAEAARSRGCSTAGRACPAAQNAGDDALAELGLSGAGNPSQQNIMSLIRLAYKHLPLLHHPDKHQDSNSVSSLVRFLNIHNCLPAVIAALGTCTWGPVCCICQCTDISLQNPVRLMHCC